MNNEKKLTTAFGAPVPDNRNSATAGKRGPVLIIPLLIFRSNSKTYNLP